MSMVFELQFFSTSGFIVLVTGYSREKSGYLKIAMLSVNFSENYRLTTVKHLVVSFLVEDYIVFKTQ